MTTITMPMSTDSPESAPPSPPEPVSYADRSVEPLTARPMPPLRHDEPAGYRWAWVLVAVVTAALFAAVVCHYFYAPADDGVDQNAYLVGGRLIAQRHTTRYVLPTVPSSADPKVNVGGYAFTGGMFVRMPDGTYFPKYPFGLPLLYACFFWLFGPDKGPVYAFLVSPASAVAAVLGTFFLARTVAGSFAAVLAAVLLATSQVMLSLADNPNSHAACTACIVWGMFLLVRWWETGRYWQGIGAGLLIGYAFTIRYTEGLLVLPVAVACLTRIRWRHWAPWVLASAVGTAGLAFLLVIDLWTASDWNDLRGVHHWFGPGKTGPALAAVALAGYAVAALAVVGTMTARGLHRAWLLSFLRNVAPGLAWCVPVVTLVVYNSATMRHAAGYDTTHESELGVAFQWRFLVRNWEMVVRTFDDLELFFVVPFALAGFALVFRRSWRVGVLLLSWVVPGVLLYTSYYWSMDFDVAYARFYLTFLPALCVAAAVAFHDGLLGGRVGNAAPAAGRRWVPAVEAAAALALLAALVLTLRLWTANDWDLATGVRHWIGPGKTKLSVTAAALAVFAVAAFVGVGVTTLRSGPRAWRPLALRVPATLAAGAVVLVASAVSTYRAVHGLRDGTENLIPLVDNFRTRLNLATVGQRLLEYVPARSVLFSQAGGGIQSPTNYVQFLRDWDVYPSDAFSEDGSRRGFGGGGGGGGPRNRPANRGNGGNGGGPGRLFGFGGGPAGGPGGGGRFNGRGGPPGMGGGFGGPGPGGGPPGMGGPGGGNNNDDTQDQVTATPVQPEQRDYHAGLYRNVTRGQLYRRGADVIRDAFATGRRVFVVVDKESLETFEDDLSEVGRYSYKLVSAWSDTALPVDRDADTTTDDRANRWGGGAGRFNRGGGGGRGRGGMVGGGMGRLLGIVDQQTDWRLVEVLPAVAKHK